MVFHYYRRLLRAAQGRAQVRGRRRRKRPLAGAAGLRARRHGAATSWASMRARKASGPACSTQSGKCLGFGVSPNRTVHRHPGLGRAEPPRLGHGPGGLHPQGAAGERACPGRTSAASASTARAARWSSWTARASRFATRSCGWTSGRPRKPSEAAATGDPALRYVGRRQCLRRVVPLQDRLGEAQRAGGVREIAQTVFEQTDWLALRLTGETTANIDTTTIRWFYNINEGGLPGLPVPGHGAGGPAGKGARRAS